LLSGIMKKKNIVAAIARRTKNAMKITPNTTMSVTPRPPVSRTDPATKS
jgi:hypothetical protein